MSKKTLQELEKEYADVMNNEIITRVTRWTPKESGKTVSEEELIERIKRYAPEAREVLQWFDPLKS
jgi:hypothetical protein